MRRGWTTRLLVAGSLVAMAAFGAHAQPASTQGARKPFRVVTTFTIIQDMAQNVAGARGHRRIHHQAGRGDSRIRADAARHREGADVPTSCCGTAWVWSAGSRSFSSRPKDVPSAVLTKASSRWESGEGPYTGKPNPHSWMSPQRHHLRGEHPQGARDTRSRQRRDLQRQCRGLHRKLRAVDEPVRKKLEPSPTTSAGW